MFSRVIASAVRRPLLNAQTLCVNNGLKGRFFSSGAGGGLSPVTRYTDDQEGLREHVRDFARDTVAPHVAQMDEAGCMHPSVIAGLKESGYLGIEVPEAYGGLNMGFTESCLVIEELSRVDPSVGVVVDIHNTLVNRIILQAGTEEQKNLFMPRLATNTFGSFCLTEASSGSDAFALQTRAEKQADGSFKLRGTKQFISTSIESDVFVVFATEDPSKRHRGITCFLVEKNAPGFSVGKKCDKLGIRASSTCELIFDDVVVQPTQILGKSGEGYKLAIEGLNEGRIGIGAQMVGLAQGAFDLAMQYALERKQFGQTIYDFQAVKHQLAEMRTLVETARVLVYNAAALKEKGHPFTQEAAMAKLVAGRNAERVASQAVEVFGGYGFIREYPIEKYYRDAKIGNIYEGTVNMQLETIAKQLHKEYKL